MNEAITLEVQPAGFYSFVKYKNDENGKPIESTAQTVGMVDGHNLLTNAGMNAFATTYWYAGGGQSYCCVGSGNTPPLPGDTQLQSLIAQTTNQPSGIGNSYGLNSSDPQNPYGYMRVVWRFENGSAAGNLQEVGIRIYGGSNPATDPLLSRALILDVNGNPTSITVLGDETLDVFWESRVYVPGGDVTGSVTLEGIVYNYTLRPLDVNGTQYAGWWYMLASGVGVHSNVNQNFVWGDNPYMPAYIATRTDALIPRESKVNAFYEAGGVDSQGRNYREATSIQRQPYTAGSFRVDVNINFDLQQGNFVGGSDGKADGIRGLAFSTGMFGAYQVVFDKPVPKTADKKWTQPIRLSWARR